MKLRVLDIVVPSEAADPLARFTVRVQVDVNGGEQWFNFRVSPLGMPGSNVHLIQASGEVLDLLRELPHAVQHLRSLVGQAVATGSVHLPQLIAA